MAIAGVFVLGIVLLTQANGIFGAGTADLLRAVFGPRAAAQIESWYLGVQDTEQRVLYQLTGGHTSSPWHGATSTPSASLPAQSVHAHVILPMTLSPIATPVSPALSGEGQWTTAGLPTTSSGLPLIAKAFVRPDPARPYAVVTLLQFDLRFVQLHMAAGTTEPGGPLGHGGPGVIPYADQQGNLLLAAFNGGFKYADGQYGMMVNGHIYVPPQPGAATVAVTSAGKVIMGKWGSDPALTAQNASLVAWRQNAAPLIDHGTLNPLTSDGAAWGGTILNSTYTWRSGLGITANGTLIYASGNGLSAKTLGETLLAAGAVEAMQTDINPFWVRAFLFTRDASGHWQIAKLHPGMQGTGMEYLQGTTRDFFYVTRVWP